MAFGDTLRSALFTGDDIADLIEGIFVSGHPAAWSTWTPTMGATGSMTFTGTSIGFAKYIQVGDLAFVSMRVDGTIGGSMSTGLTATLPFTAATLGTAQLAAARVYTNGAGEVGYASIADASTTMTFFRTNSGNYVAGLGAISGNFIVQTA